MTKILIFTRYSSANKSTEQYIVITANNFCIASHLLIFVAIVLTKHYERNFALRVSYIKIRSYSSSTYDPF